jgi:hypothetical protein
MTRWALYVLGLAALVAVQVAALGDGLHDRLSIFAVSLAVVVAVCLVEARRFDAENRARDYRRSYEASREATYTALCGAVADLGYRTTASDPGSATIGFRSSSPDLWIPLASLECEASVRQVDPNTSEVVVRGTAERGSRAADGRAGYAGGLMVSPRGTGTAAKAILDRVQATVVTYPVIRDGLARPTNTSASAAATSSDSTTSAS